MATAKFTLGTMFKAVSATASAITSTVQTVGTAAEVANAYVGSAATRQKQRQNVDDSLWLEQYIDDRSVELTESKEALETWVSKVPNRKALFDTTRAKLLAAAKQEEVASKD